MLRVTRDEPGRVLELRWEGPPPLALHHARALLVDGAARTVTIEEVRWLCVPRRFELPFAYVGPLSLSARGAEAPRLMLGTASLHPPRTFVFTLGGPGLSDRRTALEALYRAGRILGRKFLLTTRSDRLALDAALRAEPEPGALPIPELPQARAALPPLQARPFDERNSGLTSRVHAWAPGKAVELATTPDVGAFWLLNVIAACLSFFGLFAALGTASWLVAAACAAVFAFVAFVLLTQSPDPGPIRARLDWAAGTARFWSRRFDRTVPLGAVERLVLIGATFHTREETFYSARLHAYAGGRFELLAETRLRGSQDATLLDALACAKPLADSLGASIEYSGFPDIA